ncbi:hypothetical protein SAMN04487849_1042 [Micrococcus luteus]|uniref:Uncharacterized protein n=1 Tax=Micrococcus luteus TaxID=1270 RepID=A0ABD7M6L8_MICLU|nr:hypothetical protein SAMN04487849_1042 [Micrococcus luteus]
MATSGKKHWPPMGRTQWPLTPPGGGARSSDGLTAKPDLSAACVSGARAGCTELQLSDRPAHPLSRTEAWEDEPACHRDGALARACTCDAQRCEASAMEAGHDVHRRPPTPVATLPGPGRPHGCQRPHALLPRDAAVSGCPERVSAARSPTPARAVVRPTPQPCRAQGIAARPLRAAADARADVGWPAQRRCAARALMVHGSRLPRTRRGRSWRSAAATYVGRKAGCHNGGPAGLIAQGNAAGRTPEGIRPAAWERRPGQWAYLPRENS